MSAFDAAKHPRKGSATNTGNAGHFASKVLDEAADMDLDTSWLEETDGGDFGVEESTPEPGAKPRRRRGARTDVHAPGSPDFHPEAYKMLGVYYEGGNDERLASSETYAQRDFQLAQLGREGYTLGHGASDQCGHCGSRMSYAALMVREDVREYIFVGEDCLDGTFGMTSEEFARLRDEHAAAVRSQARKARIAELVDQHPLLADLTYPQLVAESDFYDSVGAQMLRNGELSEKQITAVERALTRDITFRAEREAKAKVAAEKAAAAQKSGITVPTGKGIQVEGKVVHTKATEGFRGEVVYKMRVETEDGWAVWGTMPAAMIPARGHASMRGATVSFKASIEASTDDPLYGFFSRPTGAQVLTAPEQPSAERVWTEHAAEQIQAHAKVGLEALAQIETITADWPQEAVKRTDAHRSRGLELARDAQYGFFGRTYDIPEGSIAEVQTHLNQLEDARTALIEIEREYKEEHRLLIREQAPYVLSAEKIQSMYEWEVNEANTKMQAADGDAKKIQAAKRQLKKAEKTRETDLAEMPTRVAAAQALKTRQDLTYERYRYLDTLLGKLDGVRANNPDPVMPR